jgi:hypothetical protein
LTPIDYHMLGDATDFFKRRGYAYVETPWVVPREVSEMTYRGNALSCQLGDLVGSAEQGFTRDQRHQAGILWPLLPK